MKKIILFTTFATALIACKKENATPATTEPTTGSYSIPTSTGSYWVYRWDQVDSNGTVTPQSYVDTVRITGDTIINGNNYITYRGSLFGSSPTYWHERDSSGFIVNESGKILYSYLTGAGSFSTVIDGDYKVQLQYYPSTTLQIDAGNFSLVKVILTAFSRTDQTPVNACGDSVVYLAGYYASGVGLLRRETGFYSEIIQLCRKRVSTLIDYHIEP